MNNNANVNNVSENKVFSEEFSISSVATTELTHINKDGIVTDKYQYRVTDKEGNITLKSTNNPITMQVVNAITFFSNVEKMSGRAIAIECSFVTTDVAKAEGFKTPAEMLHGIFTELSHNTINQYRRVGKFFGVREKDSEGKTIYRWRAGIDETVNVTNLTQVISLAKLPDNFEKLTKEEVDKLYSDFYSEFIESGKINLNLSQSDLKKQIKELLSDNKAIDTTFTEKKDETKEESNNSEKKVEESENDTNVVKESTKKTATEAVVLLSVIFKGNSKILTLLSRISDAIEQLPDETVETVENSDNSTEKQ